MRRLRQYRGDRHGSRRSRSAKIAPRRRDRTVEFAVVRTRIGRVARAGPRLQPARRCAVRRTQRRATAADHRRRARAKLRRPQRLLSLARTPQVQNASARVLEPLAFVPPLPRLRRCPLAAGSARRPRCRPQLRRCLPLEDRRRPSVLRRVATARLAASRSPSRWSTMCALGSPYLADVGVGYLAIDRPLRTLSGGEAQRVALTTTLGSSLVDMLYVLDEPSVGLHPADISPLAAAIAHRHVGQFVGGEDRQRRRVCGRDPAPVLLLALPRNRRSPRLRSEPRPGRRRRRRSARAARRPRSRSSRPRRAAGRRRRPRPGGDA